MAPLMLMMPRQKLSKSFMFSFYETSVVNSFWPLQYFVVRLYNCCLKTLSVTLQEDVNKIRGFSF